MFAAILITKNFIQQRHKENRDDEVGETSTALSNEASDKKGKTENESPGKKPKQDRRRKLNEIYLRKLRSLMKTRAADDDESVIDVTDNASKEKKVPVPSTADASTVEQQSLNEDGLQRCGSDEMKSESTDIISRGDQLMYSDTKKESTEIQLKNDYGEPADYSATSQPAYQTEIAHVNDVEVRNSLETSGSINRKDISITHFNDLYESVPDFVPKSTSGSSPSYRSEHWSATTEGVLTQQIPNTLETLTNVSKLGEKMGSMTLTLNQDVEDSSFAEGEELCGECPAITDIAKKFEHLCSEVKYDGQNLQSPRKDDQSLSADKEEDGANGEAQILSEAATTANFEDRIVDGIQEDELLSDHSELSSEDDLSLAATNESVGDAGLSATVTKKLSPLTCQVASTGMIERELVNMTVMPNIIKTKEQLISEEVQIRQENERILKIQIFKDLGLEESSKLSPLKRMKLDFEKKRLQSHEKKFSDEIESNEVVEEKIKSRAEESKRKFDGIRTSSTALKIVNEEVERKIIADCEKSFTAEKDAKMRNDDEMRNSVEKTRTRNEALSNLKRFEAAQKSQRILDVNKSSSEEWRKADIQQYDDDRKNRIEEAGKVHDIIQQTLSLQRQKKEMRDLERKENLSNERRRTLDAEEELVQLNEHRMRVSAERKEAFDREFGDHQSKIDAIRQEHDRRRVVNDERYAAERQSALDTEKEEKQMRKYAYLEKERLLQEEYKLRNEQDCDLHLQQDLERLDRVKSEKRKIIKRNSRLSLEHSSRRLELNERATRSENERLLQQEVAYSAFLEEEKKIEIENARKDYEVKEKRAALEKRRVKHIESVELAREEVSAQTRWDEDRKDNFEASRREKDDNASKLREEYEKNISDELETKRCVKAERKLREENERKVQIEFERRIRESASGVKERSASARRWRRSR